MAKYTRWRNAPEDIELFEKALNKDTRGYELASLVEAGAPYLYPEQDSEEWKETVIDKFTKLHLEEGLEKVEEMHKLKKEDDEMNEQYKQHLAHALWIAVERNDQTIIRKLIRMSDGPLWRNTPENMKLFEKVFNDDTQIDRLAILIEVGAPYLYPEQDSGNWKETVIDKFSRLHMVEGLGIVSRNHSRDKKTTDEMNVCYREHLTHALWIAIETNDLPIIRKLVMMNNGPLWDNTQENFELFEKVFNDYAQVNRLASLVTAGAPYLYPEQDSENWKETVIDKFTKMQMVESIEMISEIHSYNSEETDEMNESFRQHLTNALWIAVEIDNELLINAIMNNSNRLIWSSTPRNMQLFEKVFNDDTKIERLATMVAAGAPYLYPEQDSGKWKETVFDKFTKLQMDEGIEMLFRMHGNSKVVTEEIDNTYRRHIGHAIGIAVGTNNKNLINILINEDHLDVDVCTIAACDGGWKILSRIEIEDWEQKDYDNFTMLHRAAEAGRGATVKYLLEKGADPNPCDKYLTTPLMLARAATTKDEITLSILIENSDTKSENCVGMTVLQLLVRDGLYQYVPRLIELGCDPTGNEHYYHLIEAAKEGHTLTVKALLNGGSILSQTDFYSKTALDYSLESRRDATSALLIRMDPTVDYIKFFTEKYSKTVTMDELVKSKQKETIFALLDRSVLESSMQGGIYMKMADWQKGDFLEGLAKWGDDELAHHGTVRKLVDSKMSKFGYYILAFKIAIYLMFMLALSYSLIQAATVGIPRDTYTQNPLNIVRLLTDLFVLFFFISNVITEVIEVFRIMRNTHEYLKSKQDQEKQRERKWKGKLYNIFWIRIIVEYLSDLSNWFDMFALLTLLLLIILRIARQTVQWVFATLTFFLNAARLFKYIVLIPRLGPYSTIIFKILIHDVPLFSSLFLITLFIFTGGYFISLRTPYTLEGFNNVSLAQDTDRTLGVDNEIQWVFLSGLRVLLEGNVYEDVYVYDHLNWLAVCIYLAFLFLTVVVFLNVFIAQLSDRYSRVKERANQIYALQKLNFVVQIEKTSVLSACIDFKDKKYEIQNTNLSRDAMFEYFNYSDPTTMNDDAINAVKGTKQYTKYPKIKVEGREEPVEKSQTEERMELLCEEVEKREEKVDLLYEKVEKIEEILRAIEAKLS